MVKTPNMIKTPNDPAGSDVVELARQAGELATAISQLTDDQGNQLVVLATAARTNRRMIRALAISFLLDVLLTLALTLGLVQLNSNADHIQELTDRLDTSQSKTRKGALCPLYQVFLDSKSEAGRAQAPDPKQYDASFKVIEEGYRVLGCEEFINSDPGTPFTSPSPSPTE